jgi:hypothetical protein
VAVHGGSALGWDPSRRGRLTVHVAGEGVAVSEDERRADRPRSEPTDEPTDGPSVAEHREDVVRRLLERGLSPRALRSLLPEFGDVVDRVTRR